MTADLEIVTRWFQKAIDTATKQGRYESALLWSDGLDHLISMNDRAEKAEARVAELEAQIAALDCRLVGRVAELSGSHCPADRPCDRCIAERRIEELSHAYAVQGLALEDLTAERDRYRDGIRDALYMLEEQGEGSPTETAVVRDLTALLEPTK